MNNQILEISASVIHCIYGNFLGRKLSVGINNIHVKILSIIRLFYCLWKESRLNIRARLLKTNDVVS